jgi:hypothetical protein
MACLAINIRVANSANSTVHAQFDKLSTLLCGNNKCVIKKFMRLDFGGHVLR